MEMLARCLKHWAATLYYTITKLLAWCFKHWVAILYGNVMKREDPRKFGERVKEKQVFEFQIPLMERMLQVDKCFGHWR